MKSYRPKQKRGYEAEQNFLEAAKTIFAREGVARARISDIVELAGSSTGNFYFRFKNKEMLFERLFQIYEEQARATIREIRDPIGSLAGVIYFVTALNQKVLQRNVGLYRAAHEVSAKQPEIWLRFQQLTIETADRIVELCAAYKDEIPADDWELHIRRCIQLITGFTANQAIRNAGPARFGTQDMVDMLFMAAMGTLGLAPPADLTGLQQKVDGILRHEQYA